MAENNDAREERREYMHRRQTIVFAVVGAVLVVALFISSLFLFHVGGLGEVKTTAEGRTTVWWRPAYPLPKMAANRSTSTANP